MDISLLPQRFREKIKINEDGCWIWQACLDKGYGIYGYEGGSRAHRFSYETLVGKIPKGLVIDHYRNNCGERNAPCSKACVNPEHLEVVTPAENSRRGSRKTNCGKCGFSIETGNVNYYINPKSHKGECRNCQKLRQRTPKVVEYKRQYYLKNKEKIKERRRQRWLEFKR